MAHAQTARDFHYMRSTQEQRAARAQVAVSTPRKIESGRVVEAGYFTVLSLASALGIGLRELDD